MKKSTKNRKYREEEKWIDTKTENREKKLRMGLGVYKQINTSITLGLL